MRRIVCSFARPGLAGRQPWLAAFGTAAIFAVLLALAPAASAATLTSVIWTVSKSTTSATATSYTYRFTTATAASLSSVTMTVPTGTGGSPTVSSVTPSAIAGGTVALAGGTLTYSFTATSVAANQAITIVLGGITNTSTANGYTSVVTTRNSGGAVDTGTSGTVTITTSALASPTWTVSSTATGATGVTYTYSFSGSLLTAITTLTATVPPGTSGSPALGSTSGISLGGVTLSGQTLTFSGISLSVGAATVSFSVTGLTNTSTAGTYTTEIVAGLPLSLVSSGVTASITFGGGLTLTSPSALAWSGSVTGSIQHLVDGTSAHQQLSVDDETGSAAGWHITVSGTTFTSGLLTFPNSGTFVFTGSTTSVSATTAPSTSCTSCTLPNTTTTYPVAITTAAVTPTPATVFNSTAGTGVGPLTVGGSGAARPVGWWVNVPGTAIAGSYTSTITINVISGP